MRRKISASAYALVAAGLVFWSVSTAAGSVSTAASVSAGAAPQLGQPAVWTNHDLIIALHDLPVQYSCDDLWYKFRDVLLALGAQPTLSILVYQCGNTAGELGRSPKVHLEFATPELVQGAQARWAQLEAAPRKVVLTPGRPASLRESDCELLRQIRDGLLSQLTRLPSGFEPACTGRPPFKITVRALTPVSPDSRIAANIETLPKRIR
ncbi:MAG TPA: hypothetical protein VHB68_13905 [Steroidobacteraceae bacterium]|nr:hypothetical protein [Steroidobacteraceae bacterium]